MDTGGGKIRTRRNRFWGHLTGDDAEIKPRATRIAFGRNTRIEGVKNATHCLP